MSYDLYKELQSIKRMLTEVKQAKISDPHVLMSKREFEALIAKSREQYDDEHNFGQTHFTHSEEEILKEYFP